MSEGVIETRRLRLRLARLDDAVWMTKEISNPRVHCWLSGPPKPFVESDALEFIGARVADERYRVIECGGEPFGVVSIDDDLGYWLKESAWGQGYMTEAAGALVDWHFARGGGTLTSGWLVGNAGSEGVLRKLGFQDTGTRLDWSNYYGREVAVERVRRDPPLHRATN
ncbi:MAG: GNAT family N-acetyltransferase [Pseudomonadota bacterium]